LTGAHNPTGMDPTMEQWKEMSETIKKQGLNPFFDWYVLLSDHIFFGRFI
jgi:aspartate/tyrosine/aromatic aminotransferase